MDDLIHRNKREGTRQIASQRPWCHFSQVPDEVDVFHAHCGDARCRSDDQATAARSGTVCQQRPKAVVGWHVVHVDSVEKRNAIAEARRSVGSQIREDG